MDERQVSRLDGPASAPRPAEAMAGGAGDRPLTFEALFERLTDRAATRPAGSRTAELLAAGPHAIGKKLVEEAAEAWMAAAHEGAERTAEELAQLVYHIQVMMIACGLTLTDLYAHL